MHEKKFTIFGSHATKSAVERAAEIIFTACGLLRWWWWFLLLVFGFWLVGVRGEEGGG